MMVNTIHFLPSLMFARQTGAHSNVTPQNEVPTYATSLAHKILD
jgi:hypothetical protein